MILFSVARLKHGLPLVATESSKHHWLIQDTLPLVWAEGWQNNDAEGVQGHPPSPGGVWTVIIQVRSCEEVYQATHLKSVHFAVFMLYFYTIYSQKINF